MCPTNQIVEWKGVKNVTVKTSGQKKTHFTVILSCCSDEIKLLPLLIFIRKTCPKNNCLKVCLYMFTHGWMDEGGMKLWIDKIWSMYPRRLLKKPFVLVWHQSIIGKLSIYKFKCFFFITVS